MFGRILLLTIAAGATLGWLLPDGWHDYDAPATQRDAPVAQHDAPARSQPSAAQASPTPPSGDSYGGREVVIERKNDGHFYVDATVNGQLVRFLVDTGATGVALTAKDARHVGLFFSPGEFTVVGKGASGDVRGKLVTIDRISLGHMEATRVPGAIIDDGLDISLLGQSFLSRIGSVRIADDRMTLR